MGGYSFFPMMESLHFKSLKDDANFLCVADRRFEYAEVVYHNQGHRPVKYLEKKEFEKVL